METCLVPKYAIIDESEFSGLHRSEKLELICEVVCDAFSIVPNQLKAAGQHTHLSYIRFIFYYIATIRGDSSQLKIAEYTHRERSIISLSVKKVIDWLKNENSNPLFITYWKEFTGKAPKYLLP